MGYIGGFFVSGRIKSVGNSKTALRFLFFSELAGEVELDVLEILLSHRQDVA